MAPFLSEGSIDETKAHFQSAPWALELFEDPSFKAFNSSLKATSTFNSFIGRTLFTPDTIPAWQYFRKVPQPGDTTASLEVVSVIKLGSGLNGHQDTCHGGLVGVLLDEILGHAAEHARPVDQTTMTAFLNVQFKKPIRTPGIILARGKVVKTEGKKLWGKGTLEDGEGGILATSEGLFIVVNPVAKL